MNYLFLKLYTCFCALGALILFACIEFSFPLDLPYYVSTKVNRSLLETKLWLQGVSSVFLWFSGLFGLVLFSEIPTKSKNSTNNP